MKNHRPQKTDATRRKPRRVPWLAGSCSLLLLWNLPALPAEDLAPLTADRAATERVYYNHRTGTKPPFEQALPPAALESLVKLDLKKEAVLKRVYRVAITPALLQAEARRIDATTRAPEVLAELKAALGNDPERFARTMVRPIVVERILRTRFENDDALHASQRRAAEQTRADLLAKKPVEGLRNVTWELAPRPADARPPSPPMPTTGSASSSLYRIEATARLSQVIGGSGGPELEREKFYFEDLNPELKNVLRAQLRRPGDVSAVIETPSAFLVYLTREKTPEKLDVALLSVPKRSYEEWLAEQPD